VPELPPFLFQPTVIVFSVELRLEIVGATAYFLVVKYKLIATVLPAVSEM
jgi:hypothetical protein